MNAFAGPDFRPGSKTPSFKAPNCVDLFAGAGGFSLAARKVGWEVCAAVEMNKFAASTYRRNLCKTSTSAILYEKDILDLCPTTFAKEIFEKHNRCDVVLGGPPCQGFSVHRIKGAGVDDPRNRLILRYFEFVAALQPKFFLIENVPGMLWPRHQAFVEKLYAEGRRAGYTVEEPVVIDARDFGVPQRRKRVFILGYCNQLALKGGWPPPATHGDRRACEKNPSLMPWVASSEVFKPAPAGDENDRHMQHSAALTEVFQRTPINGGSRSQSGRVLPCHKGHNGHSDVYGRIDPTLPGPTMTTACINPSKGRFVHPTGNHGITLRQAARFQTFPDDFVFEGGLMAAGEQIGNAVPVQLGAAILRHLGSALLRQHAESHA